MAHSHPVRDMDKHFIIDPITRAVTNAESKKTLLMQNDHNSERFSFEIDKIVEGHDMTLCNKVEVHYVNFDNNKKEGSYGVYEVDDLKPMPDNPDKLVFTWLVSQNATVYNGTLSFVISFACVEKSEVTYRWGSGMNTTILIAKSLSNGDAISELYPDILVQWKEDLFAAVFGMVDVHVGPDEPETYPYIWFDTSAYAGTPDKNVGILTIKDGEGNKESLYPFTVLAATDQPDLRDLVGKLDSDIETINTNLSDVQNDVTDLEDEFESHKEQNTEDINGLKTSVGTINSILNLKASMFTSLVTLPSDGWNTDGPPYKQIVSLDSVLATDAIVADVNVNTTTVVPKESEDTGEKGLLDGLEPSAEDAISIIDEWSKIGKIRVEDGQLVFFCYKEPTTIDIQVQVLGVR